MKHLINVLKEAWHELHGHKTYFVSFTLGIYLLAAMMVQKIDSTLGTALLLFDILLTMIFHELFIEVRNFLTQQKTDLNN